jgi:hypothetical protein
MAIADGDPSVSGSLEGLPGGAVRLRTASHAIYELVTVPAVRYQEYRVPFQVDRIVELLI